MSGVELAPRPATGNEPRREPAPARRFGFSAVLGALVLGAVFWNLGGLDTYDESWFLQVTDRVAGGDSLYRDISYPATPLAVDVTLPFVWLFGAQALWVKLLVTACFAGSLYLLVWIGRRSGATNLELAAAGVVLLVLALPVRVALYQPLAAVLLLGCLAAALAWSRSSAPRTLALAGVLAGLAFATKQNVGIYAAVALLVAVLLTGGRIRALAIAAGSFAGTVALTLVPVAATGGLHGLWTYGFLNRDEFIDRGSISLARGFELQWQAISLPAGGLTGTATSFVRAYELLAFVLVPLVFVALAVAWRRTQGAERRRVVVVAAFALASVASLFPRADLAHVSFVVPILVVGGLYAARALVSEEHLRIAAIVLLVVFVPPALARGLGPVVQLAQGTTILSSLEHGRGVAVDPAVEERVETAADALAGEPGPVFLATPEAGILYLASGVENETPYDYPIATTFGPAGEERLAEEIASGRFATVCLNLASQTDMLPRRLVAAIEGSLVPAEDLGACRIYRRP